MEHLPECIYKPEYWDVEQSILWSGNPCICSALRACEQRVMQDAYADGRTDALDEAERAVAAVATEVSTHGGDWRDRGGKDTKQAALAAIRGLQEEK